MHILIKPCKTLSGISCSLAYIGSCLGVSFVFIMQLCGPHSLSFPTLQWNYMYTKYIKLKYMFTNTKNIHIISSPLPPSLSLKIIQALTHIQTHCSSSFSLASLSHSLSSLIINPIILLLKFQLLSFFLLSN